MGTFNTRFSQKLVANISSSMKKDKAGTRFNYSVVCVITIIISRKIRIEIVESQKP